MTRRPSVDPVGTVLRFNECINARDAAGLAALMTDDHRLIDRAGTITAGRDAVTAAWQRFFPAFPEYRNTFEETRAEGHVAIILGYATWHRDGPADRVIWTATVEDGLVAEWRIHDDTADNRGRFGIAPPEP